MFDTFQNIFASNKNSKIPSNFRAKLVRLLPEMRAKGIAFVSSFHSISIYDIPKCRSYTKLPIVKTIVICCS